MRAAVKFCGGCNPDFDRSSLWEAVRLAAGGRIDWVGLTEPGWSAALVICGCPTACPVEELELFRRPEIVALTDGRRKAEEIIEDLFRRGGNDQDQG